MKTLLLLRHAKASSNEPAVSDFERSLNDRGRKEAEEIGEFIATQNITIDLVISSPAVRAQQTTELALRAAQLSPELRFEQQIYEASPARLLEITSQIEDSRDSVLLVGHNPGMEELLALLVGVEHHMPTASLAKVKLSRKKWDQIITGDGVLESFARPGELKA